MSEQLFNAGWSVGLVDLTESEGSGQYAVDMCFEHSDGRSVVHTVYWDTLAELTREGDHGSHEWTEPAEYSDEYRDEAAGDVRVAYALVDQLEYWTAVDPDGIGPEDGPTFECSHGAWIPLEYAGRWEDYDGAESERALREWAERTQRGTLQWVDLERVYAGE